MDEWMQPQISPKDANLITKESQQDLILAKNEEEMKLCS